MGTSAVTVASGLEEISWVVSGVVIFDVAKSGNSCSRSRLHSIKSIEPCHELFPA